MKKIFITIPLLIFILSACAAPEQVETSQISTDPPGDVPTLQPLPTETLEPGKTLTICTSALPESLFLYDGIQTPIKNNIISMLLEAPFEQQGDELVLNILEKFPSLSDGDIRLEPVPVQGGQTVVDAFGELVVLKRGVTVRASGCRGTDCAVIWDGAAEILMDRMVVDFKLRKDLTWSDGTPVSGSDIIFSYDLASDPAAPGLKWSEDRTEQVLAKDPNTYEWIGRPGFTTANLAPFIWLPLPSHLFSETETWSAIAASDLMTVRPLSYGPFMLSGRDDSSMAFIPNPHYYRAGEGLPVLDRVTIRVVDGGAGAAWEAMKTGGCDVLDNSFGIESNMDLLAEINADEHYSTSMVPGESWVQLVFGIQPADYDEFYNPVYGDRPDFFGDPRSRQAIALCLDRDAIVDLVLTEMAEVWPSFLAPGESRLSGEGVLSYNTELSRQLLSEVGWVDHDANPDTPLQAWGVPTVPSGTTFSVTLLTDTSGFQQVLGEFIQTSLKQCGVEVNVTALPASELYAQGPEGLLFGRAFDLTLLSWMPMPDLDCRYYLSTQVPNDGNNWIGTNIAGLMDAGYDAACSTASLALVEEQANALKLSEAAFLEALPAVPLFSVPSVMVFSDRICSEAGVNGEAFFQSLEGLSLENGCQ